MPVTGRARLLLDGTIAASSVGVLSWYFLVSAWWVSSDLSANGKLLSAAYPLGDVVILFGALVLFGSAATNKRLRVSSGLLAVGVALVATGDSLFSYYSLHGWYETGSWFDWAYSFGWLLLGYSALTPFWWRQHLEPSTSEGQLSVSSSALPNSPARRSKRNGVYATTFGLLHILMPYLLALSAWIIVVTHDYGQDNQIGTSTFVSGFWLMSLAMARQVLTLLENQHLTVQLRRFNHNLENTIAQRTVQLKSLYELTKAVNNSLQAEETLSSALDHTRRALDADAVVMMFGSELSTGKSQHRTVLEQGLEEHPRVTAFLETQPFVDESQSVVLPPDVASHGNYLSAPLIWREQILGSIGVVRWHGEFSLTEIGMLESIGIEVAVAYKNAQIHAVAVENADRDSVTGLFNHRAIHGRLEVELQRAERTNRPLAIIMMDLNNFKLFNDTYGHPVGDQVLKRVAAALHSRCRKPDVLGRYGGDEFIAILPETDLPLAMVVAQRWRDRMTMEGFSQIGEDRTIPITLSFGIATFPTTAPTDSNCSPSPTPTFTPPKFPNAASWAPALCSASIVKCAPKAPSTCWIRW
jgi:diguanylate cyclase (GGDEF)-like protein